MIVLFEEERVKILHSVFVCICQWAKSGLLAGGGLAHFTRRAVSVQQAVAQLASFANRPRRLRRHVARNPAWKRDLLEEPFHPLHILRDLRIEFAVRPFEVGEATKPGPSWPGPVT